MYEKLKDIPQYNTWKVIKKIEKGWSKDEKFYIEDFKENKFLLRLSDIEFLDTKEKEFNIIKNKFNTRSFEMSKAYFFGECNNGNSVYMILSWVEGSSLIDSLHSLSEGEQYNLGLRAGKILKEIHSLEVDKLDFRKDKLSGYKLQKLTRYENSTVRLENDIPILNFIKTNIYKIDLCEKVYIHGDFHVGNLILTPNNDIGIIDFNRWDVSDPFEEFYKVQQFDIEISIPFAVGQINGYFNNNPTKDFWAILSIYVAHTSLFSIKWAEKFGEDDVISMKIRARKALKDFNYFNDTIPNWYRNYKFL